VTHQQAQYETAETLADNLEEQLGLYAELCDLTREQRETIESGDTDGLMAVLSAKQERIQRVAGLEKASHPLREEWEGRSPEMPDGLRERIDAAIERLRGVLGEIVSMENEAQEALRARREAGSERLLQIQKGKMLHKAYGGGARVPPRPRFRDDAT
jgi:hypothetical protein